VFAAKIIFEFWNLNKLSELSKTKLEESQSVFDSKAETYNEGRPSFNK
jgi:hypothetical protein